MILLKALSRLPTQTRFNFCDIVMPQLDGYELCAMLRRASLVSTDANCHAPGVIEFIDRVRGPGC